MPRMPINFGYFPDFPINSYRKYCRGSLVQDLEGDITPEDLLKHELHSNLMTSSECQALVQRFRETKSSVTPASCIKVDKEKFQKNFDVQHFSPEEISVKTVDGWVVVEGKHEEKKDEHGFISRQFSRRFELPEECEPEDVESHLSSDGVLSITAPKKVPEVVKGERKVPIAQTGPVHRDTPSKIDAETQ